MFAGPCVHRNQATSKEATARCSRTPSSCVRFVAPAKEEVRHPWMPVARARVRQQSGTLLRIDAQTALDHTNKALWQIGPEVARSPDLPLLCAPWISNRLEPRKG